MRPATRTDTTRARRIAGLVLAAGPARRFGSPKQLARLDGRPLLERPLEAMASVAGLDRVVVVLGAHAGEIAATVRLHGAEPVVIETWGEGQSASLRAGIAALAATADAVVVALGDQPRLDAATIARVIAAWDGRAPAVRAVAGGVPGHPVLLSRQLYPAIAALRGDVGARQLLRDVDVVEVETGGEAIADVDTPAQLRAFASEPD